MKVLMCKESCIKLFEKYKLLKNNIVWIHHPITKKLTFCKILDINSTFATCEMSNDSIYAGQPAFKIKKNEIIGIKELS